jgi:aspartyl-tRNA(Asn)/glutamyl-tRNA(Gln) amidotransferase subunit A
MAPEHALSRPAREVAAQLRSGEVTSMALLELLLERIAATEPQVKAYLTLCEDEARRDAERADRAIEAGRAKGVLHGLPVSIKDLIETSGVRTTYGSPIYKDNVPERDATVVTRLREAGAIVVGKTNTHEFALGGITPPTRNPFDLERIPGGSSGGSAVALATGQAALALGSDTGGSIRIPAAFCGVSGLKPTYNRIAATGVFPLARSLDHVGPMARTPADVRLLFEALTGRTYPEVAEPRIAVCPDLHLCPLEPGIQRAFDNAVQALEITLELPFDEAERIYPAFAAIQGVEATLAHADLYPARKDSYSPDVAARLERARTVTLEDYVEATATRERIRAGFARLFAAADLLLTPIHSLPPELRGERAQAFRDGVLPFTVPQDLAGLPSCAVPVGFDDLGLPVGVQLTGPPWSEGRVLAAAETLFSATASARAESASTR